ncbi:hypothetical protein RHS01_04756 [Rhizoctonia solani]|uniref:Uncharacterized protein n=1 Tax=Rhizoctonia solani TaxID=456999 RepID=A0A8H7IC47_9AGAM|nr:hypothetical protein RHS01_04756 [Rhizoctonia solani]
MGGSTWRDSNRALRNPRGLDHRPQAHDRHQSQVVSSQLKSVFSGSLTSSYPNTLCSTTSSDEETWPCEYCPIACVTFAVELSGRHPFPLIFRPSTTLPGLVVGLVTLKTAIDTIYTICGILSSISVSDCFFCITDNEWLHFNVAALLSTNKHPNPSISSPAPPSFTATTSTSSEGNSRNLAWCEVQATQTRVPEAGNYILTRSTFDHGPEIRSEIWQPDREEEYIALYGQRYHEQVPRRPRARTIATAQEVDIRSGRARVRSGSLSSSPLDHPQLRQTCPAITAAARSELPTTTRKRRPSRKHSMHGRPASLVRRDSGYESDDADGDTSNEGERVFQFLFSFLFAVAWFGHNPATSMYRFLGFTSIWPWRVPSTTSVCSKSPHCPGTLLYNYLYGGLPCDHSIIGRYGQTNRVDPPSDNTLRGRHPSALLGYIKKSGMSPRDSDNGLLVQADQGLA